MKISNITINRLVTWLGTLILGFAALEAGAQSSSPLVLQPKQFVFNMTAGEPCTNVQRLRVIWYYSAVATWTASANQSWLKPTAGTGSTPGGQDIFIDPVQAQTLVPGIYPGVITVSISGTSETQTAGVTLIVNPSNGPRAATWKDGRRGAASFSVDDSLPSGFEAMQQAGVKGTYFLNGSQAPDFFSGFYQSGAEIGSHLLHHFCNEMDEGTLRANMEPNITGISYSTQTPLDDFLGLAWPCGFHTVHGQAVAGEYFLYARGYGSNQLEDPTPTDFLNLKSFNSHEHNAASQDVNLIGVVDAGEAAGKWVSLVFHAELNDDGAVQHALTKDLWVAPIGSVIKYICQRDRLVISSVTESDSSIDFSFRRLPMNLPRWLPNQTTGSFETAFTSEDTVTIELNLPGSGGVQGVLLGGQDQPYTIRTEGNVRKLLMNVLPTQDDQKIVVVLSDAPTPILAPLPANLVFSAFEGTDPASQTLEVKNAGSGSFDWTAAVVDIGSDWLEISPNEGTGYQVLTASVNTAGLIPGTYTAKIRVESIGAANSPQIVEATLTIVEAGNQHFDFTYPDEQSLLSPATGWSYQARSPAGLARETKGSGDFAASYDQIAHPGTLRIPAVGGQFWGSEATSVNTLFRDLPANWTSIRMKASFHPSPTYQTEPLALRYHQIALLAYKNDDNYVSVTRILNPGYPPTVADVGFQTYYVNNQVEIIQEEDGFPEIVKLLPFPAASFFLRLDRQDAITLLGYYSVDGETWLDIPVEVLHNLEDATLAQPLRVGVYVGGSVPYYNSPPVDLHWVEVVTPPPAQTLTVTSLNPDSGAPISVNRPDRTGATDGLTQFIRSYLRGTEIKLTAGAVPGRTFQEWRKDGQAVGVDPSLKLTLDANRTLTAVYTPIVRTLTVRSANPSSGVNVAVAPADIQGLGAGTTEFQRTYNTGTDVTLTAPTVTGKVFQKWLNGAGQQISANATVAVRLDADVTAIAVYSTAVQQLIVQSSNPSDGVTVTVSPADNASRVQGSTPAAFSYNYGTTVTLTASTDVPGRTFQKWQNSSGQDIGSAPALTLTLTADQTVSAIYGIAVQTLSLNSSNPASGVSVTLSPADKAGVSSGSTPITVSYDYGTEVTVTAVPVPGKIFQKWQDAAGNDVDSKPTITLVLKSNMDLTAVHGTAPVVHTLTVKSSNPDSGADVSVSPVDNNQASHGLTTFNFFYNEGTRVTLTAPAVVSGKNFLRWLGSTGEELGTSTAVTVTLEASQTVTAVYGIVPVIQTLTVNSSNPDDGIQVTVTPADQSGAINGSTPVTFSYEKGTEVTLTAPSSVPGKSFQKWQDGAGQDLATTPSFTVTLTDSRTLTAVYVVAVHHLNIQSSNPDSGLDVGLSPGDNAGNTHKTTPATLAYNHGTTVTLTAPDLGPGKVFQKWENGSGTELGTSATVQVTVNSDLTVKAVYKTVIRQLNVKSSNPNSGADVTVSPVDNNNLSHGPTEITFSYNYGTTVTLTAPVEVSGKKFQKWQNAAGQDLGTTPALTVTLDIDRSVTAVYITPTVVQTLTVESVNPDSGVAITVSPTDNNQADNGSTKFTRVYNKGTVVSLTATTTAGGNAFEKWQRDGLDYSTSPSIQISMDADHALKAIYATPSLRTLTVSSTNPDRWVFITASPSDNDGNSAGFTTFTRSYKNGTVVSLSAPVNYLGKEFQKWQKDGVDFGTSATVQVTMDGNHALTAVYATAPVVRTLTVASSNPGSGVVVTVTPADKNGSATGTTLFTRSYNHGTVVTLTAPDTASGNIFQKWQKDGVDFSKNASADVTLDAAHKMTAVYVAPPVHTLTIGSADPNSGVAVTVSVADTNGRRNGTTKFTRTYKHGTTVTFTAPATASGKNFQKWKKDGVDLTTTTAVQVTVDGDASLTAVYAVTPVLRTLTIASSNPASGVTVTLSPSDNNGKRDGVTKFTRVYKNGTIVTLKAPATADGKNFQKWQKNGADFGSNATVQLTMDVDVTLTAVYVNPPVVRTLTVASSNPASGVIVTATPLDKNGKGDGFTKFTRSFDNGTTVTLKAASSTGVNTFQKWQKDGADFSTSTTIQVTMDGNHTLTAVYTSPTVVRTLTVASSNPSTGVAITVSPADNSNNSSGTAPFLRSYNQGKVVSLTAPATASGNTFKKWQKNGSDYSTSVNTTVTMDGNYTLTAVYATPTVIRTLTVASSNPSTGVAITVSPADNSNNSGGTAPFLRSYTQGKVVTLTAPTSAGGNTFQKWQKNGGDYSTSVNTTVTMDGNHTLTAIYITPTSTRKTLTIASLNPSSGVGIVLAPADVNGKSGGYTSFTRSYDTGAYVALMAPAKMSGSGFEKWLIDGTEYSRSTIVIVRMGSHHTLTATYAAPASPVLPLGWGSQDIGSPSANGTATYDGSTFTIKGSGADIWNTSDAFRYVYQAATGDCAIVARVKGVQNTDGWAKAGIMIRETQSANAKHASIFVTPSNGVAFQTRSTTSGISQNVNTTGLAAPYWIKIVRSGNTFTALRSSTGRSWTFVGSQTISMNSDVSIGLAVTSHKDGTLCTATMDNVTVTK